MNPTHSRRSFLRQLGLGVAGAGVVAGWGAGRSRGGEVAPARLPRDLPEAQGVAPGGILDFIDAVESRGLNLHSLMVLRRGRVVAEGWWAPYAAGLKHTLYSLSKSFTSTAVGFAVAEGRLQLGDRVVSFFPREVPAQ